MGVELAFAMIGVRETDETMTRCLPKRVPAGAPRAWWPDMTSWLDPIGSIDRIGSKNRRFLWR
jgi:hypothetical protein